MHHHQPHDQPWQSPRHVSQPLQSPRHVSQPLQQSPNLPTQAVAQKLDEPQVQQAQPPEKVVTHERSRGLPPRLPQHQDPPEVQLSQQEQPQQLQQVQQPQPQPQQPLQPQLQQEPEHLPDPQSQEPCPRQFQQPQQQQPLQPQLQQPEYLPDPQSHMHYPQQFQQPQQQQPLQPQLQQPEYLPDPQSHMHYPQQFQQPQQQQLLQPSPHEEEILPDPYSQAQPLQVLQHEWELEQPQHLQQLPHGQIQVPEIPQQAQSQHLPERLPLELRLQQLQASAPQPQAIAEPQSLHQDYSGPPLVWELGAKIHPMVTDGEKSFVVECLEELRRNVNHARNLAEFIEQDREIRRRAVGENDVPDEQRICLTPRASVRRCFEEVLQQRARMGSETIFVEDGFLVSMGSKKVVEMQVWCSGEECDISVCWDWDVRLESATAAQIVH